MKYRIVSAQNLDALEQEMALWIQSGWKPLGGVCAVQTDSGTVTLMQAIVKP